MKKVREGLEPYLKGREIYTDKAGAQSRKFDIENHPGFVAKELRLPQGLETFAEIREEVEKDLEPVKRHLNDHLILNVTLLISNPVFRINRRRRSVFGLET